MADQTEPLASTPATIASDVLKDVMTRPDAEAKKRYDMGTAQSVSLDMENRGRSLREFAFR